MSRRASVDPVEPAPEGRPDTGRLDTVVGAVMALEGVVCCVVSVPFLLFGGFGLLGLIAGAVQVWVGLVLMGRKTGDPIVAALTALFTGAALGFVALIVMAFASCDSIVNCGHGSDVPMFSVAAFAALMNLVGAVLLWRRKV